MPKNELDREISKARGLYLNNLKLSQGKSVKALFDRIETGTRMMHQYGIADRDALHSMLYRALPSRIVKTLPLEAPAVDLINNYSAWVTRPHVKREVGNIEDYIESVRNSHLGILSLRMFDRFAKLDQIRRNSSKPIHTLPEAANIGKEILNTHSLIARFLGYENLREDMTNLALEATAPKLLSGINNIVDNEFKKNKDGVNATFAILHKFDPSGSLASSFIRKKSAASVLEKLVRRLTEKISELDKKANELEEERKIGTRPKQQIANNLRDVRNLKRKLEERRRSIPSLRSLPEWAEKMIRDPESFFDLVAIRFVLNSKKNDDCFKLADVIKDNLGEKNVRIQHDYISNPKPNNYQSLHLKVKLPGGAVEFQIRTFDMDRRASEGSEQMHAIYKSKSKNLPPSLIASLLFLRKALKERKPLDHAAQFYYESELGVHDANIGRKLYIPEGATYADYLVKHHLLPNVKRIRTVSVQRIGPADRSEELVVPIYSRVQDGDILLGPREIGYTDKPEIRLLAFSSLPSTHAAITEAHPHLNKFELRTILYEYRRKFKRTHADFPL
ncbi:MAG: hypothetical protein V1835_02450 [Candidatus Micrarchaeota archaeon]